MREEAGTGTLLGQVPRRLEGTLVAARRDGLGKAPIEGRQGASDGMSAQRNRSAPEGTPIKDRRGALEGTPGEDRRSAPEETRFEDRLSVPEGTRFEDRLSALEGTRIKEGKNAPEGTPIEGQSAAAELSALTGASPERCAKVLREWLLRGSALYRSESSRFPLFAFRLHQFLTRGDTVWATLEPAATRHLEIAKQAAKPGEPDKPLYPLVFFRRCGTHFTAIWSAAGG